MDQHVCKANKFITEKVRTMGNHTRQIWKHTMINFCSRVENYTEKLFRRKGLAYLSIQFPLTQKSAETKIAHCWRSFCKNKPKSMKTLLTKLTSSYIWFYMTLALIKESAIYIKFWVLHHNYFPFFLLGETKVMVFISWP